MSRTAIQEIPEVTSAGRASAGAAPALEAAHALPADRGPRPTPGWSWEQVTSPATLEALAPEWTAVAARERWSAFARPAWTVSFWEAFGDAGPPVEAHVLRRDGALAAVVPIRRAGRLARTWRALENEHTPYLGVALAGGDPEAATRVLVYLLDEVDCLTLRRLPLGGPACRAFEEAARALEMPVARHPYEGSGDCWIDLARTPAAFEAALPKGLRRDTRKLRKLEGLGRVALDQVTSGPALAGALAECLALEQAGWKGRAGTAIVSQRTTERFYRQLAARASRAGELALDLLRLDGRIVAFNLTLRAGGQIDDLKTGYDEALAAYSPGTILLSLAIGRECARGGFDRYHLGRPAPYKLPWASGVETLGTLAIYGRHPRGRAAHALGPVLRGRLKRMPAVVRARGWVEALGARLRGGR